MIKLVTIPELHRNWVSFTSVLSSIILPALSASLCISISVNNEENKYKNSEKAELVNNLLSEEDVIALGEKNSKKNTFFLFNINLKETVNDEKYTGSSISRVLVLAWPERYLLCVAFFCLIVASICQMLIPALFGELIGSMNAKHETKFNETILVMILVMFLSSIFAMLRGTLFNVCGERVVARLRVRLFHTLVNKDICFFDSSKTGELQSRLNNDSTVLQNALTSNISVSLRYSGQIIVGIVILFALNLKLTCIMLLVIPIMVLFTRQYSIFIKKISKLYQKQLANASEKADQTFSLIRTVRSFCKETYEETLYSQQIKNCYHQGVKKAMAYGFFLGFIGFAVQMSMCLVLWYGGKMVISSTNDFTNAKLTSFILYTFSIAASLGAVSATFSQLMSAVGASERVFELIDEKSKVISGEFEIDLIERSVGVEFDKVSFNYPSRPESKVLENLSLSFEANETTALVGPSGGGKSTIISLLLRWYDPDNGNILINGISLKALDLKHFRQNVSVVTQEPLLFSCSILENISYGLQDLSTKRKGSLRMGEVVKAAKEANAHEFIMSFPDGYDTLVGERGVQLSGGQKQRIAIARAVLRKPKLLLLDEATSALDSESEAIVQQALDKLMFVKKGKQNVTCVVIAHRLSTVKNANKIIVVNEGKVEQTGTHDILVKDQEGLYYNLVNKQYLDKS